MCLPTIQEAAATPPGSGVLLIAVAPRLPGGGQAFEVGAVASARLDGLRVSDGGSSWAFPPVALAPGETLWVVSDLAQWHRLGGSGPAVGQSEGRGKVSWGASQGQARLLDSAGRLVDLVAWGKQVTGQAGILPAPPEGRLLMRDGGSGAGWTDTDAASDWVTPRQHAVGESGLSETTFRVGHVTAYASPDASFAVLGRIVGAATQRLHLHVYDLREARLVDALVAARTGHPGLDLQVLVDGGPVGQTAPERHQTADALRRVQAAGGQAWVAGHGRYDDVHLKVLVADATVAVQSENWVPTGVPPEPTLGNRGWGVAVQDASLADWFESWMAADRAAWDTSAFDLARYDPRFQEPARESPATGDYGPLHPPLEVDGPVEVTPWVAPDMTQDPRRDPFAALIGSARSRVDAQQLTVRTAARNALGWSSPDPLASSLAAAATRGVAVRVQAAAPFSQNPGQASEAGNAQALAWLSERGVQTSVMQRPGIVALHNKGLVVDGAVVVGSINGDHHSRSQNREASLLVRSPAVASYFEDLFASDWDASMGKAPERQAPWGIVGRDVRALPGAPLPILFGLVAVAAHLRTRP